MASVLYVALSKERTSKTCWHGTEKDNADARWSGEAYSTCREDGAKPWPILCGRIAGGCGDEIGG